MKMILGSVTLLLKFQEKILVMDGVSQYLTMNIKN